MGSADLFDDITEPHRVGRWRQARLVSGCAAAASLGASTGFFLGFTPRLAGLLSALLVVILGLYRIETMQSLPRALREGVRSLTASMTRWRGPASCALLALTVAFIGHHKALDAWRGPIRHVPVVIANTAPAAPVAAFRQELATAAHLIEQRQWRAASERLETLKAALNRATKYSPGADLPALLRDVDAVEQRLQAAKAFVQSDQNRKNLGRVIALLDATDHHIKRRLWVKARHDWLEAQRVASTLTGPELGALLQRLNIPERFEAQRQRLRDGLETPRLTRRLATAPKSVYSGFGN